LLILRISSYIYASCIIFQCKFNYNVNLGFGLTCFGNFQNWWICTCILYCFSMQSQLLCLFSQTNLFSYVWVCYESLIFKKFMAHSLTMLLRQNLLHKIALEYHGNKIVNDFVLVGQNFKIALWFFIVVNCIQLGQSGQIFKKLLAHWFLC
jgi:hypothetical protein